MPKELDLGKEIEKVGKQDPSTPNITYVRLPAHLLLKLLRVSQHRDTNLTVTLRDCLEAYVSAQANGVVTNFEPSVARNLDLVATHLGLERDGLVRLIVAEHFNEYLSKTLSRLEERDRIEQQISKSKSPRSKS